MQKPTLSRLQSLAVAALAALLPFGAACDQPASDVGRVELALAERAPVDGIRSAVVVISAIELVGDSGRVPLLERPVVTELVNLGTSLQTLALAEVPDGTYGELRLVIDHAWVEVQTERGLEVFATADAGELAGRGVTGELKTPSWDASGLKVKLRGDRLEADGTHRLLFVDFDLAETFQTRTGKGDLVMRPVVTAHEVGLTTAIDVVTTFDSAPEGVIFVEVRDRDGFSEGVIALSGPDEDGRWWATFPFLDPAEGPFTVHILDADGFELALGPSPIDGRSGQSITVDLEVSLTP